MNHEEIIRTQKVVGVTPDGFWGEKSTEAAKSYLRSLMPKPNPWPSQDQASLRKFFGAPGDESQLVHVPLPDDVDVRYEGRKVSTITCHRKVADSLCRVLKEVSKVMPGILLQFDGCYNNRSMRGGSLPSLHAFGAAIDFASDTNGNHQHWPSSASMPIEVMSCFAREGWLSAGAFWCRDAMHFQATR